MIYSEITKKDPKGFIIKSTNQRILLFGRLIKIIKYKEYFGQVHIFYKEKNKIYQKYVSKDYFKEKAGSNLELIRYVLELNNMLWVRRLKQISRRYLIRYKYYEYLI